MDTKEDVERILKGLNISRDRYRHIIYYIQQLIKDYNENPIYIIKEIPFNLKGNERYLTMFIIGRYFSPLFYKMDDKEKTDFIIDIADSLKFSNERVVLIAEYMTIIKKEIIEDIPIVDIIKGVINSKFTDVEKDYIIFIFGLVLV